MLKKKMTKVEDIGDRQNRRLEIRKHINASPERVFEAWTQPEQIEKWWGPEDVTCIGAKIDLQVGGKYQINNRLPNGNELLIYGVFKVVEQPNKLVYTWSTDPGLKDSETVNVKFNPYKDGTEVVVIHERIPTKEILDSHNTGWIGCLEGLLSYLQRRN